MQPAENKGIFIYRQSPVLDRSWMIYLRRQNGDLSAIGDYTILDPDEDKLLSEKKLINLVSLLNGRDDLVPLGELTRSRQLFQRRRTEDPHDPTQVLFFTYTGHGVSRESAILTLEPGVIVQ